MGGLNVQRLAARVPSPACMGEGMVRAYSDIRAYSYSALYSDLLPFAIPNLYGGGDGSHFNPYLIVP